MTWVRAGRPARRRLPSDQVVRVTLYRLIAPVLSLLLAAAQPAHAQQAAKTAGADAGKSVALKVCATCHVVAPDQPFMPMLHEPAPSFARIANRASTSAPSLGRFLSTTHATIQNPSGMPNPQLTDDQQADVIAYILSLRKRP